MISKNICLFIFTVLVMSNRSNAQSRQALTKLEILFCKKDVHQYKLLSRLNDKTYDSVINVHYKGALYIFAKFNDSIDVYQNIAIDKVESDKSYVSQKKLTISKVVYSGSMDTFIINKNVFTGLFNLGRHPMLNRTNFQVTTNNPEPSAEAFYFTCKSSNGFSDTFKLDKEEIRKFYLTIEGWQLKRLILQIYLNYNHWIKIDSILKKQKEGFYVLNAFAQFNETWWFNGKDEFENMEWKSRYKNFPFQFALSKSPKPTNNYPVDPPLPPNTYIIMY